VLYTFWKAMRSLHTHVYECTASKYSVLYPGSTQKQWKIIVWCTSGVA